MLKKSKKLVRRRKGQGLVEYALLIAGVALVCAVGVTMFGHKTAQLLDSVATVLPGAHPDDNAPIFQGQLIETTNNGNGIQLDLNTIKTNSDGTVDRLGNNVLGGSAGATPGFGGLIQESN